MSYDFDDCADRHAPIIKMEPMDSHDLEAIVTLLEITAIMLTNKSGDQFTKEELVAEAHRISGRDFALHQVDVDIVFPFLKFLKKHPGKKYELV